MAAEVRMPQLGESVTEGTVIRWLKQPGDPVAQDEPLAEIETEKVNAEIPSPFAGTLTRLLVAEGETVDVGVAIAEIELAAGAVASQPARNGGPAEHAHPAQARPAQASFSATGPLGPANPAHGMFSTGEVPPADGASAAPAQVARANGNAEASDGAGRFSPAVLRLAHEYQVDLSQLRGSGAGGRITRKDVQAWLDSREAGMAAVEPVEGAEVQELGQAFAAAPAPPASRLAALQSPVTGEEATRPAAGREEPGSDAVGPARLAATGGGSAAQSPAPAAAPEMERPGPAPLTIGAASQPAPLRDDESLEPLSATRRAIAAHMSSSVQTSPHAWMMIECDVSRLVAHRAATKAAFREREGVDLTYLPFMVQATVAALKQHPRLNSSWTPAGIVLKRRINIGIAVNTPQGLVVPVLHNADELSIAGLAKRIADLAERARARRLRLEDVTDGTFTVDNVGPIGSIMSQPIINQPQCAIVTMESIVKRPVVVDDAIAIRSMINCCLSFDHRIVDGGDAGPFMQALKQQLEQPAL